MNMLDERSFTRLADATLARLFDVLEESLGAQADIDLHDDILTVDLEPHGQWVLNKHLPNRQIWLSSPLSGAAHFDYDGAGGWVSTRGGALLTLLEAELSKAGGASLVLG